jgi:NitT/TauT family transport system ATP-binding protein
MKLQLKNITHMFRRSDGSFLDVIDNVSMDVREGELLVILGPSGCGKTTLLRITAGLQTATSGTVLLDGTNIHGPTKYIGMIFQNFTLFPWLTVYQNIAFGLELNGVEILKLKEIVQRYISLVGLVGFENSFPKQLSEGMKQRVAIARSLAVKPKVLLMDEPFASLDVKTKWEMQEMVLDIRRATNMTIIFVTHNVEEGLFLGDRVFILSARPAKIIKTYKVSFNSNRPESLKNSEEFIKVESNLTKILREGAL